MRRLVTKRLSGTVIEPLHDVRDLGGRDSREVVPLREVLPYQPVDLLVEAALPRRVWMREVEAGS